MAIAQYYFVNNNACHLLVKRSSIFLVKTVYVGRTMGWCMLRGPKNPESQACSQQRKKERKASGKTMTIRGAPRRNLWEGAGQMVT